MNAVVRENNKVVATIQTNHTAMSIEEALSIAGLDINEFEYDALTIEMEAEIADPMFTQWDLTDPSQGTIEG